MDAILNSPQRDFWNDDENVNNIGVQVGEVIDEIVPDFDIIIINEEKMIQ